MWVWVLVGIASFLLLVVALLCVPVHAVIDADTAAAQKLSFRLTGMFGLLRKDLALKPTRRVRSRSRRRPAVSWRRLARIDGLAGGLVKMAGDVVRAFRIEDVDVGGRFGTGDPFSTGIAFGVISAARACPIVPGRFRIEIEPAFTSDIVVEGRAHLDLSVQPIRLLRSAVRFFLSSPGRSLMTMALVRRRDKEPQAS